MSIELRPYQRDAVVAIERAWQGEGRAPLRRPAAVMATGLGKTVVFAELAKRWRERTAQELGRGRRAVVLAHRTELIDQAAGKLRDVAEGLSVGVVKAGRNETLADVVVGSVQTLAGEHRRRQLYDVGLVVVDEAHHAAATSYLAIMRGLGCFDDGALAVGFTATMTRGDDLALGDVWQDIVVTRGIAWGVEHGWLVRPRGVRVRVADLDLAGVRKTRGDLSAGDLGRALEDSLAPEAIAKAVREHASDRQTLLFAPTVTTSELFAEAIRAEGFTVATVDGAMPADQRARVFADVRSGAVQVLCNCMVATEGTDLPMISCVAIARPTLNPGLYVQMVGRGLRLWPGKDDCLVLDLSGASTRHRLSLPVELFGDKSIFDDEDETPKALDVDDDEVLDPFGEGFGTVEPDWRDGPLVSHEVDLFHGSSSAWLQTHAGVWFLPAGDRLIAILPGEPPWGGYDVVAMHKSRRGESRWVKRAVSDLAWAMSWAEGDVTPDERRTAQRSASWRRRDATMAQKDFAHKLGIVVLPGMTSGELGAQITTTLATRRIDANLPHYALSGASS